MKQTLFVGMDIGGTSTRIAFCDPVGSLLAHATGPGAGFTEHAVDESVRRLAAVWTSAWKKLPAAPYPVAAMFAGFGSVAAPRDARVARHCLRLAGVRAHHLGVGHDGENAQAGAQPSGPGVHVIAGTGSVVIARDVSSRVHRVGGWGPGVGDEGGGWWIAALALRQLTARADRSIGPTPLDLALLRALKIREPRELLAAVFSKRLDRAGFAALSHPVFDLAAKRNRPARALLSAGAEALGLQVVLACQRARLKNPAMTVSGGVFEHAPRYARTMTAAAKRRGVSVRLITPAGCPLAGALLLARRFVLSAEPQSDLSFVRRVAEQLPSNPNHPNRS